MYQQLFNRLLNGETLTDICKDPNLPDLETVFLWLSSNNEECIPFQKEYRKLRQFQRELLIDEMLKVSKNDAKDYFYTKTTGGTYKTGINRQHFQRCKLRIDTIREALKQLNAMDNINYARSNFNAVKETSTPNPALVEKTENSSRSSSISSGLESNGSVSSDPTQNQSAPHSKVELPATAPLTSSNASFPITPEATASVTLSVVEAPVQRSAAEAPRKLRRLQELEQRKAEKKRLKIEKRELELMPA
jgi:hypothetical protein